MEGKVMAEAAAEGLKPACLSTENTDRGSMVEDFFAVVKGGSSESVTALVAKKLPTPKLMNLWGDGVNFNPDFIRTTVSPRVFVVSKCVYIRLLLTFTVFPAIPAGGFIACWKEQWSEGLSQCHQDWHTGRRQSAAAAALIKFKNKLYNLPNNTCLPTKTGFVSSYGLPAI